MDKQHQKHAKLTKPNLGKFGRNEFVILGTPCGEIKNLARNIAEGLSSEYKLAYVDADHKSADDASNLEGSALASGYNFEYADKIDFHRFDEMGMQNEFDFKRKFINQDLVLINGNHFSGHKQIVIIDSRKPLEKKLEKLTKVVLILFQEGENTIPDYLKLHLSDIDSIPTLAISDRDAINQFIRTAMIESIPPINGLVLAGGRSTRMKRDKAEIQYFGQSHKKHMFDLLTEVSDQAYYAVRPDQVDELASECVVDSFTDLGPYGAILSAFRSNPNAAWLVTACDQPFLTKETLALLISKRNPSKVATAFYNPETDFPEPLITLWEPRAYAHLLHFLSLGYSCPRKVLINTDIEMVHLEDSTPLKNVNTPEEYEEARQILNYD